MSSRYRKARRWLRRHGLRFHRRRYCELHVRRVWFTTRATRSKRHAVFCSRACKAERAQPTALQRAAKVARLAPKCRRPDKHAFATEAECREYFRTLLSFDADLEPYLCRAGHWHVGHRERRPRIGELLDEETAAALRGLVKEEASG